MYRRRHSTPFAIRFVILNGMIQYVYFVIEGQSQLSSRFLIHSLEMIEVNDLFTSDKQRVDRWDIVVNFTRVIHHRK
ncbi:hypothetical protein ACW0KB_14375 [Virgibacillus salarius]